MLNMKKISLLFVIFVSLNVFAQQSKPKSEIEKKIAASDTVKTAKPDTAITDLGVAVAPSTVQFRTKPGTSETKYITVTNDTRKFEKFKVSVADYTMNDKGAVTQLPVGESHEYGLSKWISITPAFIELKPGEAKKVAVTVKVPEEPTAYRSAWAIVMIDQTTEKKYLAPSTKDDKSMSLGVIPVFGFGVYIFQNPPNVRINKVEITRFYFNYDAKDRYVHLAAKNVGDGLGFCKSYVEIFNTKTGYKEKMFLKQFTIFPGMERVFDFTLPGNIPKGTYKATGILDFGSEEEIETATLDFEVN